MNRIKCLQCSMILIPIKPEKFKQCDCDNKTFIDGSRFGAIDMTKIWLMPYEDESDNIKSNLQFREVVYHNIVKNINFAQ